MKILISTCLMIVLCFLISCTPKQEKVERIVEDGVEVVLNRTEPYAVTGANAFTLEKTLTIDTENDEIAEMGLTEISHVDVDSKGKIFLANRRAKNSCVFIFDKAGLFVSAFGNRGEGPEEVQNPIHMVVSDEDEIFITDRGKVVMFSNSGEFIKELRIDREY